MYNTRDFRRPISARMRKAVHMFQMEIAWKAACLVQMNSSRSLKLIDALEYVCVID